MCYVGQVGGGAVQARPREEQMQTGTGVYVIHSGNEGAAVLTPGQKELRWRNESTGKDHAGN